MVTLPPIPQYRPFLRFLQTHDRSVPWLALAVAALPVDGTTLGPYAPFWSPISPALFAVYCALNWRSLRIAILRYLAFFLLPVVFVALSIPGWLAFGLHRYAAFMSVTGVLGALATLAALDIAFRQRHVDWRPLLRLLVAAYWVSFGVGVAQWLGARLRIKPVLEFFDHFMLRSYVSATSPWGGGRPQFLFAEPSYIGMHLFGVLLPLFWMMRRVDRVTAARLRDLIVVFAAGSLLMGAGTRIVLDSLVALAVVVVLETRWRGGNGTGGLDDTADATSAADVTSATDAISGAGVNGATGVTSTADVTSATEANGNSAARSGTGDGRRWRLTGWRKGAAELAGVAVIGAIAVLLDSRLLSIARNGAEGDGSFFARIYQSLGPLAGLVEHPWTLLTGYGAGGLADAAHAGSARAVWLLNAMGMDGGTAGNWYASMNADTMWTMCAYTNIAVEYGFVGLALLVGVVLWWVTRHRAWNKPTVCWLVLLAYLYIQFEGYAFAALPLFIWAINERHLSS